MCGIQWRCFSAYGVCTHVCTPERVSVAVSAWGREGGRGLFWRGSAKTDSNLFYYQPQTSKQPLNQPQAQTGIGVTRRHCLSAGDVMCWILYLFGSVCNLKQLPSKCEHCTKGLLLGSFDSRVDDMYTIYMHKFSVCKQLCFICLGWYAVRRNVKTQS